MDDGPSKMDISDQRDTYDQFWVWTIRTVIFVVVVLLGMLFFLV